ncbi:MAG: Bug family tripartite tricarboxylate transporter substrate binding protein [Rhodospirillaceae bacterium]
MIRRLLACSVTLLGALATTAPLAADNYPTRPVRMIVPFAPGGASDFVARIIQPRMSELLGQQVVIDNRSGAAGNIGVEVAANATADGYTFLLGNVGTMAINPNIFTKFPIKPTRDLIAVSQVVDVPGALVVHPSIPAKTAKEFVAYLKANPGKLNYGSPGPGSANRIEMEAFLLHTGTKATHVPYKGGAGPAMIGLLGNEVQTMFVTYSSAITFVKQGRIRMLGVTAPKRVAATPDVPTMSEQGFKEMTTGSWQGVFLPKGTSRAVVNKLFSVTTETMKNAEVQKRLQDGGVDIVVSHSPDEFAKFVASENARFAKVIKDAKIETE